MLDTLGVWAKPFAATGGLAALGAVLLAAVIVQRRYRHSWLPMIAAAVAAGEDSDLSFWLPALAVVVVRMPVVTAMERRRFLRTALMSVGAAAVAGESVVREKAMRDAALPATDLYSFEPPRDRDGFGAGLVRAASTTTNAFYAMSKNTVDPAPDPNTWRLRITVDGQPVASWSYADLLSLPRQNRWVTLRCISNTLTSNLIGTAHWTGVQLKHLISPNAIPAGVKELAVIGVDGHGDSLPLDYAWSEGVLFALGMNGKSLDRTHGFPVRLLCPRYYGLKNVKWIGELRFVTQPYVGTWPKLGYTKEPRPHISTAIDKVRIEGGRVRAGGVAYAGDRGIQRVEVRADGGAWFVAQIEPPLSAYAWTRWIAEIPVASARLIEARAQDGTGAWQSAVEGPLFPDGVKGPTVKRLS
jgi:DMSO/TMAO reductase YedYZ molybdopterin-dependent catalytic subunit